jgi:hypothetical protein
MDKNEVIIDLCIVVDRFMDSLSEDEISLLTNEEWKYIIDFSELARMKKRNEEK